MFFKGATFFSREKKVAPFDPHPRKASWGSKKFFCNIWKIAVI